MTDILSDFNAVKPVSSMNYEPKMLGLWSVNPEKTAREFFRFGARIKNFWTQNEKILAPRFYEC